MNKDEIKTYAQFWPIYLKLHSQKGTQRLHFVGLLSGIVSFSMGILLNQWTLIALAPVLGYGFAWYSHFYIEKNRPATWTHPWWSLISDFRMAFFYLRRKL